MKLIRHSKPTPAESSARDDTPAAMPDDEAVAQAGLETWTRRNDLMRRAQSAALIGCLACAPIAVIGTAWTWTHPTAAVATVSNAGASFDERNRVSLYGRDAVMAWLGATQGREAQLASWFPMNGVILPGTAPKVSDPIVASADQVQPHKWNVRVAFSVSGLREYVQVPLIYNPTTTGITALTIPQPVPGLLSGSRPDNPLTQNVPTTSDLGHTLAGFTTALACGQGDITRYTSPGATIPAITPAPYSTVQINSITSDVPIPLDRAPHEGGTAQVQVNALATGKTTGTQNVAWTLTVRARAGRWEVATIDSVPGIRGTSPVASGTATPTPSASGALSTPNPSAGVSTPTHK